MKLVESKGTITKEKYDSLEYDERLMYWRTGEATFTLISELGDDHLQNAFCYAQTKELVSHNNYTLFNELVQNIEDEASKRGIVLKDIDTEYHRKSRKIKSKISDVKGDKS